MSFGVTSVNAEFDVPEMPSELPQEESVPEQVIPEESYTEESTEEPIVSEIPLVKPSPNIEDIGGLMEEPPVTDNQDMILNELIQIRLCLQILVFGVFPLCVAVIGITKLITWFSRRFT